MSSKEKYAAGTKSYVITYISAKGINKTDVVKAVDHHAAKKVIEDRGGKILTIYRGHESPPPRIHAKKHTIIGLLLAVVFAVVVVGLYWLARG